MPAEHFWIPTVTNVIQRQRRRRIASGQFEPSPVVHQFKTSAMSILNERDVLSTTRMYPHIEFSGEADKRPRDFDGTTAAEHYPTRWERI